MPLPPNLWIYFCNTVLFGLFVWAVQKYFSNASDRRFADFRGAIDHQLLSYKNLYDQQLIEFKVTFDREIEAYKSELKFLNDKFAALHSKRLDVIKEMNDHLVRLNSAMVRMVSIRPVHPDPSEEQKIKESILIEAQKAYADYNNYLLFNSIYFSEKLAEVLEKIRREYFSAHWDLFEPQRLEGMGMTSSDAYKESGKTVIEASKQIRDEIPKVLKEIEQEFRSLLGVT